MYDLIMLLMSTQKGWESGLNNRNLQILNQARKDPKIRNILTIDFLPHTRYRGLARAGREIMPGWLDKRAVSRRPLSVLKQIGSHEWNLSSVLPLIKTKTFWQEVKSDLKALNFDTSKLLAWSYDPFHPEFFDEFQTAYKIFDAVDNWAVHGSFLKRAEELMSNYKLIGEKADVIFMVNSSLSSLFSQPHKTFTISNGVDYNFFSNQPKILPQELLDAKHPIIGYIGVMEGRLDLDLFLEIVKKNPDKTIAIVGGTLSRMPWRKRTFKIKELAKFKNVIWCQRVPYKELNLYLHAFDLAIVPHKITALTKSMDPMKIYEYLAAGKPVVTTEVIDPKKFRGLIYEAKKNEDFLLAINKALMEDNAELRKKRQKLARESAWEKRYAEMSDHLPFQILSVS